MDVYTYIGPKFNHSYIMKHVNNCIKKASYECLHIHVRYIMQNELEGLFKYILSLDNHKLSMNIINSLYNIKYKNIFINMYFNNIINKFIDDTNHDNLLKCKEVIQICSNNILNNNIKNIIKNLNLEQLQKLIQLFDSDFKHIKENAIYGNLDIIEFITNKFGLFKSNTIIHYIIDNANSSNKIDFSILKWIIQNYKDSINENILYIINNINNFNEENNSYIVIDYIFYLMGVTNEHIFKIFKKIIFNGNNILFSYMSIKYFSHINNFNYFEYACLFSNPNAVFNNTVIGQAYIKTILSDDKMDSIFNNVCKYKIKSSINWFITFFPDRYSYIDDKHYINISNMIKPIISKFYMDKKYNITQQTINQDCCVCLENKKGMIQLNCHTTHIICSECFETSYNIKKSCPLCRGDIKLNDCIINI